MKWKPNGNCGLGCDLCNRESIAAEKNFVVRIKSIDPIAFPAYTGFIADRRGASPMPVTTPSKNLNLSRYYCRSQWAQPYSYYQLQGQRYTGVTTVLRATQSPQEREQLVRWQAAVGAAEAERIRKEGCQRGRQLHRALETYWRSGRKAPMNLEQQYQGYWESLEPVLAEVEAVHLAEGFVWHPSGFAGVADALVTYRGELYLCDWKASAKPKRRAWVQEHCLQVAAYAAAVNRVYQSHGVRVGRGLVVIAQPHTEAQVFTLEPEEMMAYWHQFQERLAQFANVYLRRN